VAFLVDAGLPFSELGLRLEAVGGSLAEIEAVVVTHEHGDHVQGVGTLARRLGVPVYLSWGTYRRLADGFSGQRTVCFAGGESFQLGDAVVHSFCLPHDAAEPVGLVIQHQGVRLGVVTDLGYVTQSVRLRLRGVNGLVLEANHDPGLLRQGPYPWPVKQRVQGRLGHLSNAAAAGLLREVCHAGLRQVVLAHLSKVNNRPQLAQAAAEKGLEGYGGCVQLSVAEQERAGELLSL